MTCGGVDRLGLSIGGVGFVIFVPGNVEATRLRFDWNLYILVPPGAVTF